MWLNDFKTIQKAFDSFTKFGKNEFKNPIRLVIKYTKFPSFLFLLISFGTYLIFILFTNISIVTFSVIYLLFSWGYFFLTSWYYASKQAPFTKAYRKYTMSNSIILPLTTNLLPKKIRQSLFEKTPELKDLDSRMKMNGIGFLLVPVLLILTFILK